MIHKEPWFKHGAPQLNRDDALMELRRMLGYSPQMLDTLNAAADVFEREIERLRRASVVLEGTDAHETAQDILGELQVLRAKVENLVQDARDVAQSRLSARPALYDVVDACENIGKACAALVVELDVADGGESFGQVLEEIIRGADSVVSLCEQVARQVDGLFHGGVAT